MPSSNQIYYVAGILEGEGSFGVINSSPCISLNMTDEDTVTGVRNIMSPNTTIYRSKSRTRPTHKAMYRFGLFSNLAIQWMMTIYPLVRSRRREQIKLVLDHWKASKRNRRGLGGLCWRGHPQLIINKDYTLTLSGSKYCLYCSRLRNKANKLRLVG